MNVVKGNGKSMTTVKFDGDDQSKLLQDFRDAVRLAEDVIRHAPGYMRSLSYDERLHGLKEGISYYEVKATHDGDD